MHKVLIVDDEPLVRIGVKSSIHWDELELVLIGEAADGQQALELIEKHMPEIVLLDIGMPVMDGIELLKIIRKREYSIQVLILSCHNEFDYVKQALKLGAFDYILKLSLNTEELARQMVLMKEHVYVKSPSEYHDPKKLVAEYLHRLINHLPFDGQQSQEAVNGFRELLAGRYSRLLLIKLEKQSAEDLDSCFHIVSETLNNALKQEIRWFYGVLDSFRLVLIVSGLTDEQTDALSTRIVTALKAYINTLFHLGISSPFLGEQNIHEAIRQADAALGNSFYTTEETVFYFDRMRHYLMEPLIISDDIEKSIYNYIEVGKFDEVHRLIDNIFEENLRSKSLHPSILLNNMIEIASVFVKYLRLFNLTLGDISREYTCFFETILRIKSFTELREVYNRFIDDFSRKVGELKKLKNSEDVLMAKAFIAENYQKPLRLEDVAKYINMSKTYFSYMFKKKTNRSYVSYLNEIRIDQAKKLLQTGTYKVYEVAEIVGYNNTNYFYKIFKKLTGQNPNDFNK